MIDTTARYTVSTYDVADRPGKAGKWSVRRRHLTPRGLVRELRKWRERGYDDDCSILVEREGFDELAPKGRQAATSART